LAKYNSKKIIERRYIKHNRRQLNVNFKGQISVNKVAYIGIDYSLLSPGICVILEEAGQQAEIRLASVYHTDDAPEKLLAKKDGPFGVLESSKTTSITLLPKHHKLEKGTVSYSCVEKDKLVASREDTDLIISLLKKLSAGSSEMYIAMEGISFGSPGNTLIDIAMATGILREKMTQQLLGGDAEKLFIFSPGSIKKFAGKGNFKKHEIYDALLESPLFKDTEYVKLLRQYKPTWVTPAGMVKKPCEDINDSIFVAGLLRATIKNELPVPEPKVKKSKKDVRGAPAVE
jgi:Holliday junction resolvasome RuvABC endonuclease subunit